LYALMKGRQPPAALISEHRLERFYKLAQLWLLRVAGWLVAAAGLSAPLGRATRKAVRPFTKKMTAIVFRLIALKALSLLPLQKLSKGGPPRRDLAAYERTLFGARLRQLVKAKDPRAILSALLMLLQNAGAHAERLARRLRNGFTRRRGGFVLEPRAALVLFLALSTPARADTS
jgi:hypothetical protein